MGISRLHLYFTIRSGSLTKAVKNALIKDGWTIIADPYTIRYKDAELFADLAAEKPIAAEQTREPPLNKGGKERSAIAV